MSRPHYTELVALINEVYFGIKAESLVIFDYASQRDINDQFWLHLEQPKILLSTASKRELRHNFNSQVLSVVLMDDLEWSNEQWHHFEMSLRRWSHADVIFVTNIGISSNDETVVNFFGVCWLKGFSRILMTSRWAESTLTFAPFPRITVKHTSSHLYLQEREQLQDVQGYRLKASAGNNPPRALVYYNKNKELMFNGLVPQLIAIFAQRYNFTLDWVLMPNFESYTLTDCLKYLLSDQIDVCGDFLPFNERVYVIASPIFINYAYIQVPFSQTIPKFKYFLQPFRKDMWLLVFFSLVLTTFAFSLINRFKFGSWQVEKFFLMSLQSILYSAFRMPPWKGLQRFLLLATLTLGGFIISNLYITFLSSIVTTNVYESQIDSLDELKQRKITILTNDIDVEILQLYDSFGPISDNYLKVDIPTYQSHRRILDPRYAFINFEDKCSLYMYQQKFLQRPLLRMMPKPLAALWANIPMRANWPMESLLNHFVLTMFDTGMIQHLQERAKEESILLGLIDFFKTTYLDTLPLSISHFEMPAILLSVGYLSSVLSFIAEHILYRLKASNRLNLW